MSVESLAIALHHSRAQGTARLVLLGIANHDGDNGAWPSLATLAKYAGGVSERTVRRALRDLEDLGEIRTDHNAGGVAATRPDLRPNLYHVLLRCPADCDRTSAHRTGGHTCPGVNVNGRTPVSQREDTGVTNGRTHVSGEPLKEPSVKRGGTSSASDVARTDRKPSPTIKESETHVRRDRCPAHQLDEYAPPCWNCKAAREHVEAEREAREQEAREDVNRKRREALEAKAARIAACGLCDSSGYTDGGGLCSHDPDGDAERRRIAAEYAARIRQSLA